MPNQTTACPNCKKVFKVPSGYLGKTTRCKNCKTKFKITIGVGSPIGEDPLDNPASFQVAPPRPQNPATPVQAVPVTPTQSQAAQPVQPVTVQPVKPAEPPTVTPVTPIQPAAQPTPVTPVAAVTPVQPATPVQPIKSVPAPVQEVTPVQPVKPTATPVQPVATNATPVQPTPVEPTPVQPRPTPTSVTPVQPLAQVTPVTPVQVTPAQPVPPQPPPAATETSSPFESFASQVSGQPTPGQLTPGQSVARATPGPNNVSNDYLSRNRSLHRTTSQQVATVCEEKLRFVFRGVGLMIFGLMLVCFAYLELHAPWLDVVSPLGALIGILIGGFGAIMVMVGFSRKFGSAVLFGGFPGLGFLGLAALTVFLMINGYWGGAHKIHRVFAKNENSQPANEEDNNDGGGFNLFSGRKKEDSGIGSKKSNELEENLAKAKQKETEEPPLNRDRFGRNRINIPPNIPRRNQVNRPNNPAQRRNENPFGNDPDPFAGQNQIFEEANRAMKDAQERHRKMVEDMERRRKEAMERMGNFGRPGNPAINPGGNQFGVPPRRGNENVSTPKRDGNQAKEDEDPFFRPPNPDSPFKEVKEDEKNSPNEKNNPFQTVDPTDSDATNSQVAADPNSEISPRLPSDRESHQLNISFSQVKAATSRKFPGNRVPISVQSKPIGRFRSRSTHFLLEPNENPMIGLDAQSRGNDEKLSRIVPVFSISKQNLVAAKTGYAVGGINVSMEQNAIAGIQCVFMRRKGNRLDPSDTYLSPWIGRKGSDVRSVSGDGKIVFGIYYEGLTKITSIGLIHRNQ